MVAEGLTDEQARSRIFMVDRFGLLTDDQTNQAPFQSPLAQPRSRLASWGGQQEAYSLMDVVSQAKPSVLIGVSGQPGLFSEAVIGEMYRHCSQPIVMPLSNPTSRAEALAGRYSALDRW